MAERKAKALLRYGQLTLPEMKAEKMQKEEAEKKKRASISRGDSQLTAQATVIWGQMLDKLLESLSIYTPRVIGNMPLEDVDDDPTETCGWALGLSIFYVCSFILAFIVLYIMGVRDLMSAQFLSLVPDPTSDCNPVPKEIHQSFTASWDGYWDTNVSFSYNNAIYVLTMTDTTTTNQNFSISIGNFSQSMLALGEKGASRSFLWTSLALMTFQFNDSQNHEMFYSSAEPQYVFDQEVAVASISSVSGLCLPDLNTDTPFDYSFDGVSMTLQAPLYFTDSKGTSVFTEPCPAAGNFAHNIFNNVPTATGDMGFTMTSAVLAYSLNMNITHFIGLITVDSPFVDKTLGLVGYQDPYYSGRQDPVFCLNQTLWSDATWVQQLASKWKANLAPFAYDPLKVWAAPPVCFVAENFNTARMTLFYPYMNQVKNSDDNTRKRSCVCPDDAQNPDCNNQDYFVSFVYNIPALNATSHFNPLLNNLLGDGSLFQLALKVQRQFIKDGDLAAQEILANVTAYTIDAAIAYNEKNADPSKPLADTKANAWASWALNGGAPKSSKARMMSYNDLINSAWKHDAACTTCGAIVFESLGTQQSRFVFPVNKYGVQLSDLLGNKKNLVLPSPDGPYSATQVMCVDALSQRPSFIKLANSTPISLVEPKNLQQAAMQSLGNAFASANAFINTAWLVLGFIVVFYRKGRLGHLTNRAKKASGAPGDDDEEEKEDAGGFFTCFSGDDKSKQKDHPPQAADVVSQFFTVFEKYEKDPHALKKDVDCSELNQKLAEAEGHNPEKNAKNAKKHKLNHQERTALKIYKNNKSIIVNEEHVQAITPAVIKLQNQSLIRVLVALTREVSQLKLDVHPNSRPLNEDDEAELEEFCKEYLVRDTYEKKAEKKRQKALKAKKNAMINSGGVHAADADDSDHIVSDADPYHGSSYMRLFDTLETFVIRHEEDSDLQMSDHLANDVKAARLIIRRKHEYKTFGEAITHTLLDQWKIRHKHNEEASNLVSGFCCADKAKEEKARQAADEHMKHLKDKDSDSRDKIKEPVLDPPFPKSGGHAPLPPPSKGKALKAQAHPQPQPPQPQPPQPSKAQKGKDLPLHEGVEMHTFYDKNLPHPPLDVVENPLARTGLAMEMTQTNRNSLVGYDPNDMAPSPRVSIDGRLSITARPPPPTTAEDLSARFSELQEHREMLASRLSHPGGEESSHNPSPDGGRRSFSKRRKSGKSSNA